MAEVAGNAESTEYREDAPPEYRPDQDHRDVDAAVDELGWLRASRQPTICAIAFLSAA